MEGSLEASEASIIDRLEQGAQLDSEYSLEIRETARRYPHWREQYALIAAQVPNAPSTEEVLASTPPTVTKSLVVK